MAAAVAVVATGPLHAVGERASERATRFGPFASSFVPSLFLWRGWTRDWWRHRRSWPERGGVNDEEERCETEVTVARRAAKAMTAARGPMGTFSRPISFRRRK